VAYIGGRGTLWGPAVIAFPLTVITLLMQAQLANLPGLELVLYGLLLILVMIFRPAGFAGLVRSLVHWLDTRSSRVPESAQV
jgi:branched-chain amino acid transport system permease protein